MKTLRLLLPLLLCLTWFSIQAQSPNTDAKSRMKDDRREEIESMKVAFLTRKLSLSPDEAKKFWPVYDQYANELKTLRESRRTRNKDARADFSTMNDKDVEKVVDAEIIFRQQELDIMKKYHAQFKQVLPIKKVALLYSSEEEFKRELIEKIKERRQEMKK
ncbi:hypothetical protein BH11BAC2_BH11BAC2_16330 [soil metagenome]